MEDPIAKSLYEIHLRAEARLKELDAEFKSNLMTVGYCFLLITLGFILGRVS